VQADPLFSLFGPPAFMSALATVLDSYHAFLGNLSAQFPDLLPPGLVHDPRNSSFTFNGAGSTTFTAYAGWWSNFTSPLNDFAFGSLLLKPNQFVLFTTELVQPVFWVGGAIVKVMGQRDPVPFLDDGWKLWEEFDPEQYCQSVFVANTGASPMQSVQPVLYPNPFYASDSGQVRDSETARVVGSEIRAAVLVELRLGSPSDRRCLY
jgi:hypothetical protein